MPIKNRMEKWLVASPHAGMACDKEKAEKTPAGSHMDDSPYVNVSSYKTDQTNIPSRS